MPVDESQQFLRALNYAAEHLRDSERVSDVIHLEVIEWLDENEESTDEVIANTMEEEGRRMLRSIMIPKAARAYERMVKLGYPATKIVEMAEKLNVDRLVMGAKGLSNSEQLGHVSSEVLELTSIPVMLMK